MKRDPNSPIPGFEEEFTGTVGHEKRIHKTHFSAPGVPLRTTKESDYEWKEIRPGHWVRRRVLWCTCEEPKWVTTINSETWDKLCEICWRPPREAYQEQACALSQEGSNARKHINVGREARGTT